MWRVIGQDKTLSLLDYSLRTDTIAHAYLVTGPRHIGKRTLALDLAQALNCDGPELPCGQCPSCRRILEGKHADVSITDPGSKTEIGIDDVRALQRLASLPPYEGKCKAFIIKDAEYLSSEAANALLKILEEPPQRVVWLLLVAEEESLLSTVVSRCQKLELQPVSSELAQETLIKSYGVDTARAQLLSRLCHGCLGWAISALADDDLLEQRSQRVARLLPLAAASLEERFSYAQNLAGHFSQSRRDRTETIETWLDWWRDLLLIRGGCRDAVTNIDYTTDLEEQARGLSLSEIREFIAGLCSLKESISRNVNPRLALESLMLDLPASTRARNAEQG